MFVESCIPVIPSQDIEKSLRLWTDGLGFSPSSEMREDGSLIFCMLQKGDMWFMLNQRERFYRQNVASSCALRPFILQGRNG